jgi:hypothetical protein
MCEAGARLALARLVTDGKCSISLRRLCACYVEWGACILSLSIFNNRNRALNRKTFLMQLNALNFMQCLCLKITFSAVRTCNNRDIFYNQNVLALTVGPCNPADTCTRLPAFLSEFGQTYISSDLFPSFTHPIIT